MKTQLTPSPTECSSRLTAETTGVNSDRSKLDCLGMGCITSWAGYGVDNTLGWIQRCKYEL